MSEHTKGPWHYDIHGVITGGDNACTSICTTSQHQWERAEGLGSFVDDCHRRELIAECKANAHLVAAAPELLEACKELREVAAAAMRVFSMPRNAQLLNAWLTELENLGIKAGFGVRAQSAISKAEGAL